MMKVYEVRYWSDCDWAFSSVGFYSSREKAEEIIERCKVALDEDGELIYEGIEDFEIREIELDKMPF